MSDFCIKANENITQKNFLNWQRKHWKFGVQRQFFVCLVTREEAFESGVNVKGTSFGPDRSKKFHSVLGCEKENVSKVARKCGT